MGNTRALAELWLGRMPLEIAFWRYAIIYGLALNVAATVAALGLVAVEAPIAIAVAVHLLPVPYSVLVACGVWRSADRHPGRSGVSTAARVAVIVWFCFLLVI